MAQLFSLTKLKYGINRLRTKGGASLDYLYDFVNGYLTHDGSMKCRQGTIKDIAIPTDSRGLCTYQDKAVVFHHNSSAGTSGILTVMVLPHPVDPALTLKEIHFAVPILQYLYVVAEYSDSSVYHFWLQATKTWAANTVYKEGDVVQPTTPNGYAYKAKRLGTAPNVWAPNITRALNDVVVPTVANGYKFTVTAVTGTNPASGSVEPTWPETAGSTVIEGNEVSGASTGGSSGTSSGSTGGSSTGGGGTVNLPPEVIDRYGRDTEAQ